MEVCKVLYWKQDSCKSQELRFRKEQNISNIYVEHLSRQNAHSEWGALHEFPRHVLKCSLYISPVHTICQNL